MKRSATTTLRGIATPVLLLSFVFMVSGSCHRDVKKDKGIIVQEFTDICNFAADPGDQLVIRSQAELQAAMGATGCTASSFGIDFNQHVLLGRYIKVECKLKKIFMQAKQEDAQKRIVFSILVKSKGSCDQDYYKWVWATVPVFPSDYTVYSAVENR